LPYTQNFLDAFGSHTNRYLPISLSLGLFDYFPLLRIELLLSIFVLLLRLPLSIAVGLLNLGNSALRLLITVLPRTPPHTLSVGDSFKNVVPLLTLVAQCELALPQGLHTLPPAFEPNLRIRLT